jgi:hypothetical protein
VLLLLGQPDQSRLSKPWLLEADRRRRAPCRAATLLAQIVGASGGALCRKPAPFISQSADSSLTAARVGPRACCYPYPKT